MNCFPPVDTITEIVPSVDIMGIFAIGLSNFILLKFQSTGFYYCCYVYILSVGFYPVYANTIIYLCLYINVYEYTNIDVIYAYILYNH